MDKEVRVFKAISDPISLRLALLLAQGGEICVCKLVETLKEPQFKISRHLGMLRTAGLVEARRQGTWMYYRLTSGNSRFDRNLHNLLADLMKNHPQARKDIQRFKASQCQSKE